MQKRRILFSQVNWLVIGPVLALVILLPLANLPMSNAQSDAAVPTLVPPTPLPVTQSTAQDSLRSQSVIATLQEAGRVRVGILYNEPPYGVLTITGDIIGYDADIARALAETWGVEADLVQVMRTNGVEMLQDGRIDLLMGAQVRYRSLDNTVEFSQSYRVSRQTILTRADDAATSLFNMANRRVAYVLGTAGEHALNRYQTRTGLTMQAQPYLTLDLAIRALYGGQVDGVVGNQDRLLRAASEHLDQVKLLDGVIMPEPYAIAMPRQDAPLRTLVNHTLQYLLETGTLVDLHESYFPGEEFAFDALPLWDNIGDAPKPDQYSTTIDYPQQYVVPRLQANGVLRVAETPVDESSPSEQRVRDVQRQLIDQMAARWGVRVEYISGNPVDLIASGAADVGVGITPDWSLANRVDFSQPYLLHGDRMMTRSGDDINGFSDLRGMWVSVISSDTGAGDRAQAWADSIGVRINLHSSLEPYAARTILQDRNADVIFGDSLKLIPHLEENPGDLRLTERWYTRDYRGFLLPRNDLDFRLLVDYTLQAMDADGTLDTLLRPLIPPGSTPPQFDQWPNDMGDNTFLGFRLTA